MELVRTVQCEKCPWLVRACRHAIPRGYDEAKHRALRATIAPPDLSAPGALDELLAVVNGDKPLRIMSCHEEHAAPCVGWLHHQLGPGNNVALRLSLRDCDALADLTLAGEQRPDFDATLE